MTSPQRPAALRLRIVLRSAELDAVADEVATDEGIDPFEKGWRPVQIEGSHPIWIDFWADQHFFRADADRPPARTLRLFRGSARRLCDAALGLSLLPAGPMTRTADGTILVLPILVGLALTSPSDSLSSWPTKIEGGLL